MLPPDSLLFDLGTLSLPVFYKSDFTTSFLFRPYSDQFRWTITKIPSFFYLSTFKNSYQLHPSTENWIKDYWVWPCPSEQDSVSPTVSLSHQEAFISRKLIKLITWTTVLSNSMKLWAMLCRATQDGRVMVENSAKTWSTEEGNGKPLQYSWLENPMNSMKRQKDMTLKGELPWSVGIQYTTGEEWRNNSRKNEETEPKWKQSPVVDVTDDGSKVQ